MQMSKLYNTYEELKKENSNLIYLFKSGIFFIALDKDAYTLSNLFSFKITNFTPTIVKCGFPCSSYEKYLKLFNACNLNTKIIELNNSSASKVDNYQKKEKINNILDKINSLDINSLSVKEAFNIIEELQKCLKNNQWS